MASQRDASRTCLVHVGPGHVVISSGKLLACREEILLQRCTQLKS